MELVITQNITQDGVIEMIDDWFAPAGDDGDDPSDQLAVTRRQMAEESGLLWVGRRSSRSAGTGRSRPTIRRASPSI